MMAFHDVANRKSVLILFIFFSLYVGDLTELLCFFRLMQCLAGRIRNSFPLRLQTMSGSQSSTPKSALMAPSDFVWNNAVDCMIRFHDNMLRMSGGNNLQLLHDHSFI